MGEPLSPVREPLVVLENLKLQLGSDAFSAQYQQAPVPPGGAMIKRYWIKRYDQLPPLADHYLTVQSWDTASKGGPENDFSVCTTWLVTRDRRWFLIDVLRKRLDYPALKQTLQAQAAVWKAARVLIEDAGAGTALFQELRGRLPAVVAIKPDRDKITRMAAVSAKFESGLVFLPKGAPWLADFEAELFAFPGAKHDDQCELGQPGLVGPECTISDSGVGRGARRHRALVTKCAQHSLGTDWALLGALGDSAESLRAGIWTNVPLRVELSDVVLYAK